MNKFEMGRKQYQNGMKRAKWDVYQCGSDYARKRCIYGLQGASTNYYKGYRDYIARYC